MIFFLDIITKVMATRQEWYWRPEHQSSFQTVHTHIYWGERGATSENTSSSTSQLQLPHVQGKMCPPLLHGQITQSTALPLQARVCF